MSMANVETQETLELFEGQHIDRHAVRFAGQPKEAVGAHHKGQAVAYVVLGLVDALKFSEDEDGFLIREHHVKLKQRIELPYNEALELFDRLDRRRQKDSGVYQLFDDE